MSDGRVNFGNRSGQKEKVGKDDCMTLYLP